MSKLIVAGLLLAITIAVVIWNLNKNKKGTTVLGQEMADASKKEKQRIDDGNSAESP
jgi:hypothetical protein